MCTGIAVAVGELPEEFLEQHGLTPRVHRRGGEPEVRFWYKDSQRRLPVWHEGQLKLVRWGVRRSESKVLPPTGWTWLDSLENGKWCGVEASEAVIVASSAYERGVWFRVWEGIRGVLVQDEAGREVVYMVCEPASHYFQVMTRSDRMPVILGERY
jgi:hypothetical protein